MPPVGAPAPAMIVSPPDSPPPYFQRMQCFNFRESGTCPRGNHCLYVHGPYRPDRELWESLHMPGRDPPQNPQQPPLGNYQPPPPGSPIVVPTPETEFPDDQGTIIVPHFHAVNLLIEFDSNFLPNQFFVIYFLATPTEEEGNNIVQVTFGRTLKVHFIQTLFNVFQF